MKFLRFPSTILGLLLSLPVVLATGIIFPLYIYPGTNCASWSPVLSSISSHPSLPFYIVINPASGPGASGSQPDSNWQACTTQLNSHTNVVTVGYVSTQHGARSASAVTADISTYAGWGASYRPKGIFFDEASSGSGDVSKYSGYAMTARSALGSNAFVVLNPGTAADSGYYPFSNIVVTAENFYSSFSTSQLTFSSATPANKQAVILHDGPATTPTSLVNTLVGNGLGALFITNFEYVSIPSDWANFVAAVSAAN